MNRNFANFNLKCIDFPVTLDELGHVGSNQAPWKMVGLAGRLWEMSVGAVAVGLLVGQEQLLGEHREEGTIHGWVGHAPIHDGVVGEGIAEDIAEQRVLVRPGFYDFCSSFFFSPLAHGALLTVGRAVSLSVNAHRKNRWSIFSQSISA